MDEKYQVKQQWQKIWSEKSLTEKTKLIDLCNSSEKLPYFLKWLPHKGLILEAGCGAGQWVIYLNKLGYNLIGIDIVSEIITFAKRQFSEFNDRFFEGNILKLDFPDNTFDAYISLGVIEHFLEGPQQAIIEMKRVLKPNGIAIVYVPLFNYFCMLMYWISNIFFPLKSCNIIRRIFGKSKISYNRLIEKKNYFYQESLTRKFKKNFYSIYLHNPEKGRIFFEYKWRINELRKWLSKFNFKVLESVYLDYNPFIFDYLGRYLRLPVIKNNSVPHLNFLGNGIRLMGGYFSPYIFAYGNMCIAKNEK